MDHQSSTNIPQQEPLDDTESMTRKTACMVSRANIPRRTCMQKDSMIMTTTTRIPASSPLVLLLCAVILTLADIQTTCVVSSFIHQPPMAFLGGTLPYRLQKMPFDQSSSWVTTGSIRASGPQQQAMQAAVLQTKLWSSSSSSSSTQTEDVFVEAQDLDALQQLFAKYCDKEGLMSKQNLERIPAIAQLLEDGDLMPEEFSDIWEKAPKFPDVPAAVVRSSSRSSSPSSSSSQMERIDVDSFVQVYRDIDDLFEDDDDDDDDAKVGKKETATPTASTAEEEYEEEAIIADVTAELESSFKSLIASPANNGKRNLSKKALRAWNEVETLVSDGMLSEEEFLDLWKMSATKKSMDLDGFLKFNNALDQLFDFDNDEEEVDLDSDDEEEETKEVNEAKTYEEEEEEEEEVDLSSSEIFDKIQDGSGLVDLPDLKKWDALTEMLQDGELLESELEQIFEQAQKSPDDATKLDKAGFIAFAAKIESLFEDVEEEEDEEEPVQAPVAAVSSPPRTASVAAQSSPASSVKQDLMRALEIVNDVDLDEDDKDTRLPCGLESTESEINLILDLVSMLEKEPSNIIRQRGGAIIDKDLVGTWDMVYTSSSAMKFNKGLSGLGGSFPNGKFGGLRQTLVSTKFLADVEYVEHIKVKPDTASFDVKINGDWNLRSSVSLFTGEPSIVMTVAPERVTYGPTSTRADHWKSLGPMNMLDVTYLDEDIRIMRGNTSVENIFIFRRSSSR